MFLRVKQLRAWIAEYLNHSPMNPLLLLHAPDQISLVKHFCGLSDWRKQNLTIVEQNNVSICVNFFRSMVKIASCKLPRKESMTRAPDVI